MELSLTIRIGNAGTVDEDGAPDSAALAALLRDAADRLESHGAYHATVYGHDLLDVNGNRVGGFQIREAVDQ
jgi:hypothetical protein